LNSHQVTENGAPPLYNRNEGGVSTQENDVCPQSPILKKSQPKNEVHPQSPIPRHTAHTFRITHLKEIVGVILHILRAPHIVEKGREISLLGRQIIKVLRSEGVNVE